MIPENVTSIGNYAFSECTELISIALPISIVSIGDDAFQGCTGLTTIELPSALTSIGDNIFEGCTNLSDIYYLTKEPVESEGAWTGDDIYSHAKLHVFPGASTDAKFSTMDPWKGFYDKGNVIALSFADFDMDGSVTIEEAIRIANHVVGNEIQGPFMKELADVNENDVITISDAVGAVDIVLSQSTATTAAKISAPYTDDFEIADCLIVNEPVYAGSNLADFAIDLDNTTAYVALQADIKLPEGMMLESVTAGSRAVSHTLMQRQIGENTYRVVLFNFSSVEFDENTDPLFTLHLSNGSDRNGIPVLSNIIASDAKGMKYRLGVSQSETTAVGSMAGDDLSVSVEGGELIISGAEGETASIFTTDGCLVRKCRVGSESVSLTPGIYIVTVGNRSIKTMVK